MKKTPSLSMTTHMFCHAAPVLLSSVGGVVAEGAARAVGVLSLAFVSAWGAARWLTPSLDPDEESPAAELSPGERASNP